MIFWSEVVAADTEWCSAEWDLGHGLELAGDKTPYWLSNPHKSGIIDIGQIDNVKLKVGKGV